MSDFLNRVWYLDTVIYDYDKTLYKERNVIEIVLTPMTKAPPLAVGTEQDDVADFDLALGNQYAVDPQFHELAPLGEVGVGQTSLNPSSPTFRYNPHRYRRYRHMMAVMSPDPSSLVNQAGKSIIFRPDDPGVELIASVGDPAAP